MLPVQRFRGHAFGQLRRLHRWRNQGDGAFTLSTLAGGAGCSAVWAGDLDGYGDDDLVAVNKDDNTVSVWLNLGDGEFSASEAFGAGYEPAVVCGGDFDGDGDVDLAIGSSGDKVVTVLLNDGTGAFGGRVDYLVQSIATALQPLDADGDGDLDLAVVRNLTALVILENLKK